jgi:hypothetical protein
LLKLITSTKTILAFVISFILGAPLISAYESVYIDFNTDFSKKKWALLRTIYHTTILIEILILMILRELVFSLNN